MPLDATAIACLVSELTPVLSEGRIDKIYQPERDEIVITVRTPAENLRLLISAGHANPRLHLTAVKKKNPIEAPLFCMLLRKHLSGGKITAITQPDFERMVRFTVSVYNELGDKTERYLIAEFAGRNPNIILTDENGKIIDAVHHTDLSQGRGILPGLMYSPPPLQEKHDPFSLDEETCLSLLSTMQEAKAVRALGTLFRGVSPMAARCIAAEFTGDEDAPVSGHEEALAKGVLRFFARVSAGTYSPSLLRTPEGATVDFTAYTPYAAKDTLLVETMESLSDVLEAFYIGRDHSDRMRQKSASLKKRVTGITERLEKKIGIHLTTLQDTERMEKNRIYGELLCANLYRTDSGRESIILENFYNNMEKVEIPLDKTKNLSQNAQMYFKKYRKMKTAAVVVREELKKAEEEKIYMESVLEALLRAEDEEALAEIRRELVAGGYIREENRSKKQKEAPSVPLEYTVEGFSILVGRNNRQNDAVTLRLSRADDLWLHVKNMPGSHVLIRTEHREVPDSVILSAAQIAAYYSGGRQSGQVPVDYTKVKNVWKPSGAAPGRVLYEKQNTVYVTPRLPENS